MADRELARERDLVARLVAATDQFVAAARDPRQPRPRPPLVIKVPYEGCQGCGLPLYAHEVDACEDCWRATLPEGCSEA